MDDSLIIMAIANRDENSFEYLVDMYEKKLYGFIYNMIRNHDIARDLTQDVFVKVYQNLYKFNTDYPIRPWLFKIAYNTTLNYFRKNKRRVEEVELEEDRLEYVPSSDYIEAFLTRDAVIKEIRSFKPDCRAIFILKIVEELPFEQIALLLGASTASVKLKFYRNRKALIGKLEKSLKEV